MSNNPEEHPVPVTLELLETIFSAIKKIATVGALDEAEGLILHGVTQEIVDLYDRFADREMRDAFAANGETNTEEMLEVKERIRTRVMRDLARNNQPALRELALRSLGNLPKC